MSGNMIFMPPPFEEWWRSIKCYPCLCVRPSVHPSFIKIWCPPPTCMVCVFQGAGHQGVHHPGHRRHQQGLTGLGGKHQGTQYYTDLFCCIQCELPAALLT